MRDLWSGLDIGQWSGEGGGRVSGSWCRVSLFETKSLMAEIDQVIAAHGGWPKAFEGIGGEDTFDIERR